MSNQFFIGDPILYHRENAQERIVFLGAEQLGGGRWRVHLSREIVSINGYAVVPMRMDVIYGQTIRMPRYGIFMDRSGNPVPEANDRLYGVAALRFLSITADSLELEYEFPSRH